MSEIRELTTPQLPEDCYLFKHSTRCPVSARAAQTVRSHPFDLPVYWVNVIEQRELSNWVADTYGVEHESPQLLEIRGGSVRKVLTHYDIRAERL